MGSGNEWLTGTPSFPTATACTFLITASIHTPTAACCSASARCRAPRAPLCSFLIPPQPNGRWSQFASAAGLLLAPYPATTTT